MRTNGVYLVHQACSNLILTLLSSGPLLFQRVFMEAADVNERQTMGGNGDTASHNLSAIGGNQSLSLSAHFLTCEKRPDTCQRQLVLSMLVLQFGSGTTKEEA